MASPSKLVLILNRIPLNPSDTPIASLKSHARHYLSPIRYRGSRNQVKHLPKLIKNLQFFKSPSKTPNMSELFIKSSSPVDLSKLTTMIQNKSKLTVTQRNNNGYIKNSQRKRIETYSKIRSFQASPSLLPQFYPEIPLKPTSHLRSISTPPRQMVDATFNTDY